MTRFDASDATERRKLFADAVTAHRERASPFLTVEAELTAEERAEVGAQRDADADDSDTADTPEPQVPWVQFAEQTANLDCTDDELDRLKSLLAEFPEFRIDQMETPEEAEGTNVRITARADANRLAGFFERVFLTVYERPSDYRAWVVQL